MLRAYRSNVDEKGTIRLPANVNLPPGGEVLVVVLNEPEVERQPDPNRLHPFCLCGCEIPNNPNNPEARFSPGHDARAESTLDRAAGGQLGNLVRNWDRVCIPTLVEAARRDPGLVVAEYGAERILELLSDAV